ncbi:MAG: site-specific integrase [Clostridia bacterium]|nr:site-specific integrase [Clostridia bacterium]
MSKAELIGSKDGEEREFWEVDEYLKFRDAISDKPIFYYAFEVLFWCGLRLGEMQALTAEDLDLEAKTLRVDESYARLKKKDIIGAPKTKAGKRTIAIHDDLALELKEYLECLGPIDPKARIFPVSKSGMHHEMERGCKLSGVKKITIHGLRHSHISMLMEIGVPAVAIAPRVGQKRTSMTMHYGHPYEKRAREIANNINEMAGKQNV